MHLHANYTNSAYIINTEILFYRKGSCLNLYLDGSMFYVSTSANVTFESLLQFITGAPYYSSMEGAVVKFSEPDQTLPVAHACSSELVLPTAHKSYRDFRVAVTKALELSGVGFGLA